MSDRNKAVARAVFEVWGSGELDRLDALVAGDVVHHDPYDRHAADGLEGMKATIAANRERFPDLRLTVEDQVAEEDLVATRWAARMTDAASGREATLAGITIDRFAEGKIAEAWRSYGMLNADSG
jgi:ketosteroid isomerase-like protein